TFLVRENREALQQSFHGFRRSLWVIAVALALALLEILIARHEGTLHTFPSVHTELRSRIWGYVIWSFLQQFILQEYFFLRLLRILRSPAWAVATAAT